MLSPSAGPVSQMRDILVRGLKAGFEDHCGVRVAGARWPWSAPDFPCIIVMHGDEVVDPQSDTAGMSTDSVRFDVVFVTGEPGNDGRHELQDHWIDFLRSPHAMTDLACADLFSDSCVAVPVLESIGPERVTEMFNQFWVASISTVRTELHVATKKGAT